LGDRLLKLTDMRSLLHGLEAARVERWYAGIAKVCGDCACAEVYGLLVTWKDAEEITVQGSARISLESERRLMHAYTVVFFQSCVNVEAGMGQGGNGTRACGTTTSPRMPMSSNRESRPCRGEEQKGRRPPANLPVLLDQEVHQRPSLSWHLRS
jgi:hypothetical protein